MRKSITGVSTLCLGAFLWTEGASANGLFEDRGFQFRNPAELGVLILQEDLRQKKINGLYDQVQAKVFNTYNSPIGNYSNVTVGDNSTVNLEIESENSGTISAESELNGLIAR